MVDPTMGRRYPNVIKAVVMDVAIRSNGAHPVFV
jgi:hypothetical protein